MAVPITGALSLAKIRNEFEQNNYSHSLYGYTSGSTSLAGLWTGTYGSINTASTYPGVSTTHVSASGQPHEMSEFRGYDHDAFGWGTPGSITSGFGSNAGAFNIVDENTSGHTAVAWSTCRIVLSNVSSAGGTITFDCGDGTGSSYSAETNSPTLTWAGALTSLQARWEFVGCLISAETQGGGTSSNDVLAQARSLTSGTLASGSATTASNLSTGTSVTGATDWFTIRTTAGTSSLQLYVEADETSDGDDANSRVIGGSGDSLKLRLRANGYREVVLFTRSPTFRIEADSYDDGST